jgi:hypothetical protein
MIAKDAAEQSHLSCKLLMRDGILSRSEKNFKQFEQSQPGSTVPH